MNIPAILLISVLVALALFSVLVLVALNRTRRLTKVAPPPPPCKCPGCGSELIDVFSAGLWDGEDALGRGTGGTRSLGTCKLCGVHCSYLSTWDNDQKASVYEARVLTEDQWKKATGPHMKLQQGAAAWPFGAGAESGKTL